MRRVPSSIPFVVCCLLSIGAVCSEPLAAQQPPSRSEPGIAPVGTVSLNGTISDAANHQGLDGVIVELDSSSGGAIGTAITSGNGAFHFENLTTGTYTLVVDQVGFQTVNERVVVLDSPLYGIQIELLRASEAGTATNKGPASVSVRELSIPRRAHAQMEKGLALLYGKSDYQGSLRPFEEAIQQYPNYYEAYAQIGVAYMKLTDTVNSEKAFRKSIALVSASEGRCSSSSARASCE